MSGKNPPKIPILSDDIATLPVLGAVKGYYLLLLALFAIYILTKNMLVGLAAGALIFFIVAWEFYAGVKTSGWKSEIVETVIALVFALLLWFGSGWLLNTPTPINAIVSCSMLPSYERGDMVLLQGAPVSAPVFDVRGAYDASNKTARVVRGNESFEVPGSLFSHCSQKQNDAVCAQFASAPAEFSEYRGAVKFNYGVCTRYWPADKAQKRGVCVVSAEVDGNVIPLGNAVLGNDLVVYAPKQGELFALVGDIVHRAVFGIRTPDGAVHYFTKGDNNALFDAQAYDEARRAGNSPVDAAQIKGKVIARVPYIGNLKMFITPPVLLSTSAENGCDSYFVN